MTTKRHAQAEMTHKARKAASRRRVPSHDVRHICGGVSDMTLWRWLNDEALEFPRPIYIGRRRYWVESEILTWLDARPETAAA